MAGLLSRRARRSARVTTRRKRTVSATLVLAMLAATIAVIGVAPSGAVTTTNVVGSGDISPGGPWASDEVGGSQAFVTGPGVPPSGVGSLNFTVTAGQHRNFYNYSHCPVCGGDTVLLSSITSMSYSTYRNTSGSSANAVPAYQIQIDGDPGVVTSPDFTTLNWEPSDNGGVTVDNTWETWSNLQNGLWWSSQPLPGFGVSGVAGERHTWNDIKAANPNAIIKYGFGPNIGTGPAFNGSNDKFVLGISGNDTVFDFEPNCTTACFVSPAGNDNNTGLAGDPFLTIQKGVSTVSTGGTVTVAAGTYNEAVTIPKSLTLKGANFGVNGTAARGAESTVQVLSGAGKVFDITTPNPVTIDGFTTKFTGTETVGGVLNNTNANNVVTFTHNIVRDSAYVNALFNVTQVGTATIKFNKFDTIDQQTSPGSCVVCAWGNPSTQAVLDIQSNTFSNLTDDDGAPAININDAGGTVNANTFSNIHQYGILLADTLANLNITNNTFTNIINDTPMNVNRGSAIRTFGQPNITGPVNITGNTFTNSAHAVKVANDFGIPTIPASFKVYRNAITSGFSGDKISVTSNAGPSVDATCNWWGAASPPSYPGVTTTPYLTTSNLAAPCTGGVPFPTISVGNVAVIETNSGTTPANVPVTLSSTYPLPVTVKYATANGTAKTPDDYPALSGTLTIPANTLSASIPLLVKGGVTLEDNETFVVNLSNPTNATLTMAQTGTITIRNDELPKVLVTAGPSKEGVNRSFIITLKQHYAYALNLNAKTVGGTAFSPGDFTAVNTTVPFPSQDVGPHTVLVQVKTDGLTEANETYTLQVTGGLEVFNRPSTIASNNT